jgi:hypothetical protein
MAAAVNDRSAAIEALAQNWPMLEALMAGTPAMREAGEKHMPRFTLEHPDDFKARVSVSTLFPAFRRTVSVMVGKPFSSAITYGDDVPANVRGWCDDVDLSGVNLDAFAAALFTEALAYGLAGILVDAPPRPATAGPVVTRGDERSAGIRPYMVRVHHDQIIGYRTETRGGRIVLTQLRLREDGVEPDGEYGEKIVERVRVLTPGAWQVFRKVSSPTKTSEWLLESEGQSGLDVIPFVPIYGQRLGYMRGASPLLDLAFLNVKHWQSQSDQDDSVMYARKRLLALVGGNKDEPIVSSSNSVIYLPIGGDVKVAQGSAESVRVGQEALAALEDQMIQAGAELLVKKPGGRSATEAANDADANKSDLQRLVEGFEDSLDFALYFMAQYANLPTGGHVTLFKDFGADSLGEASGQLVLAMQQGGLISKGRAIAEMKRRGYLAAEVDAEEEAEQVEAEGPALGSMGEAEDENEAEQAEEPEAAEA